MSLYVSYSNDMGLFVWFIAGFIDSHQTYIHINIEGVETVLDCWGTLVLSLLFQNRKKQFNFHQTISVWGRESYA